MKTFLVGGAVRNSLLGLPIKDRDWVVVGEKAENLLAQGFMPVGSSFPVFLHPQTKEEYALARAEKKVAKGHTGFAILATPDITLEQDLHRRDITINAIAYDKNQHYIDPYNGLDDIATKTIRHISNAFCEDPLRVFRVARFAAQLSHLGFVVAPETIFLMRQICQSHDIHTLSIERIKRETTLALQSTSPSVYFSILKQCGALAIVFPELAALIGIPQTKKWHPEIDSFIHTMFVIHVARKFDGANKADTAWFALMHDFGKAVTDKKLLPSHKQHEINGIPIVKAFCTRFGFSQKFSKAAQKITKYHLHYHRIFEMKPNTIVKLFTALDAFRDEQMLIDFLHTCEADALGRYCFEDYPCQQSDYLLKIFAALRQIRNTALINDDMKNSDKQRVILNKRIQITKSVIAQKEYVPQ